jgi:hypothetical protein
MDAAPAFASVSRGNLRLLLSGERSSGRKTMAEPNGSHETSEQMRHGRDRDGVLDVDAQRKQRDKRAADAGACDCGEGAAEHSDRERDRNEDRAHAER